LKFEVKIKYLSTIILSTYLINFNYKKVAKIDLYSKINEKNNMKLNKCQQSKRKKHN